MNDVFDFHDPFGNDDNNYVGEHVMFPIGCNIRELKYIIANKYQIYNIHPDQINIALSLNVDQVDQPLFIAPDDLIMSYDLNFSLGISYVMFSSVDGCVKYNMLPVEDVEAYKLELTNKIIKLREIYEKIDVMGSL